MKNMIKRISSSFFTRTLAACLLGILLIQNVIVYYGYRLAAQHLDKNDPRQLQNRSETMFFFAPVELRQDSAVGLGEIVEHLKDIAYAEVTEPNCEKLPATYAVTANSLSICARFPKRFPNSVLKFNGNRLASISTGDKTIDKVEIEPLPMENAVVLVSDTKLNENLRTRRLILAPSAVPELVSDAVTRTEDKNFFRHRGVNWFSVTLRPIISRGSSGGSSITQQLIKNNIVYGARDEYWQTGVESIDDKFKTVERKFFAEVPMALAIEDKWTKDEILAAYLSMNYMGNIGAVQLQGFEAASREFFDLGLMEISDKNDPVDVSKAAILAGMIQSPLTYLKYVRNGEKCEPNEKGCRDLRKRRDAVLDLMHADMPEVYPTSLIEKVKQEPLNFVFASKKAKERPIEFESRTFIKYAMENENLPVELLELRAEEGEVQVFTSLDARLQRELVEIVAKHLKKLQPAVDEQLERQKLQNPEKVSAIVNKCREQRAKDPAKCENLFKVRAALVAMDAQSGEILAMTSGIDANAKRSPGSLHKPFFYLKANESGVFNGAPFTPATFIDTARDKNLLSQYCAEDENLGTSGTALDQLAESKNIGACVAAQSAGIPVDFVGLLTNSKPEKKLIAALGGTSGSESSLLDLVKGYSIFARNGVLIKPNAYKSAFQSGRNVVLSKNPSTVKANPEAAFVTKEMMKAVIDRGTAAGFRQLAGLTKEVQVVGKTGSGMIADLWFIAVTPKLIVGVWVGMPENFPLLKLKDGFTGGKIAAPLAARFMKTVKKYRPDLLTGEFYQPAGVVKRQVNSQTGCAVTKGGKEMFFIEGREPQKCS